MPEPLTLYLQKRGACSNESEVQGSSSVFQMNICAKNPRLRKI